MEFGLQLVTPEPRDPEDLQTRYGGSLLKGFKSQRGEKTRNLLGRRKDTDPQIHSIKDRRDRSSVTRGENVVWNCGLVIFGFLIKRKEVPVLSDSKVQDGPINAFKNLG